jgi:hypothetical protein
LLFGATATTSDAAYFHGGGGWHGGGWHGGGWRGGYGGWRGGGWHGGGWGNNGWAWGLGGLAAGAIIGSALASPYYGYGYGYGGCYQYQPVYNAAGVYIGNQLVNVCY